MASRRRTTLGLLVLGGVALALTYGGTVVLANHAWGNYHWARTTSSFDLTIVNSTTDDWDSYVTFAVADWSSSTVLNMVEQSDSTAKPVRRQCDAPAGTVRICNDKYGYNGWLGIAGIWIDGTGHIVAGYTKLNDSYFSSGYYNTPDWKQSVTCQELGHDVGLDHQDEDFDNTSLASCMDYGDPPWVSPNSHDYDQLEAMYADLDGYDSYASSSGGTDDGDGGGSGCNAPPGKGCNKARVNPGNDVSQWGLSLGRRGQQETFIRIEPDGMRHLTFVTWVVGR